MTLLALLITALGLSTDAFAAALARGAARPAGTLFGAMKVGAVFGASEGTMCLAGWLLASHFAAVVTLLDHWIALTILSIIGGRMIRAGWLAREAGPAAEPEHKGWGTLFTALGTSVDAAAVGVALAFVEVNVWEAVAAIGTTSLAMSTLGFLIGPHVGRTLGGRAEMVGGAILIALGIGIFIVHTFPLA